MDLLRGQVALVIAAHPDDEVIGCGGTIAMLAARGAEVQILLLADGVGARHPSGSAASAVPEVRAEVEVRREAARRASHVLGAASVEFGEFADNRLDAVDRLDVARTVEVTIERYRPDIVLTHHAGDVNIDHRRVHEAVVIACRPQPGHCLKTLLFFEVASSTEWQPPGSAPLFAPHCFVDITDHLADRRHALEAYSAEMRPWPHPRSYEAVEHLARWRGATVGVEAAEAFMLGRHIQRG